MIGEKIKSLRNSKGITLTDCAERANVSKSYLSNIERNLNQNPSIQIIEKIAGVLDVEVSTLIETQDIDNQIPENEWLEFIKELKNSGVTIDELKEYKSIIEFAKWKNGKSNSNN